MKISKKTCAVIEWSIAAVLLFLCTRYSILAYGNFTAAKAHEQSEKTFHYGPSQIIKTINLDGGKIYLCRYKDWYSADTVRKGIIKWYPENGPGGYPIDYTKKVSYSWSTATIKNNISVMKVFGYVNDSGISKMVLEINSNNTVRRLQYSLDKSRMFIFYWEESRYINNTINIKGMDDYGKIIYEDKFSI